MFARIFSNRVSPVFRRYRADQCGAAAVEFTLIVTLMTIPILNVVDFAMYFWDRMQLDNAAQVAAQAAWATCNTSAMLPATTKCTNLNTAVTAAAQSTSLGTNVTVTATQEGYYCTTTAGSLVNVATPPTAPPANCSGSGGLSSDKPGDYVLITTRYTYTPVFAGVSVVSHLPSPINRTAWMRLG